MLPSIAFGSETVTSDELHRRAQQVAAGLATAGLKRGDVVAIMRRNELATIEAMMGARWLGCDFCPINWHFLGDEAGFILRDSHARALIIDATLLAQIGDVVPSDVVLIVTQPQTTLSPRPDEILAHSEQMHRWPTWDQWREHHKGLAQADPFPGNMIPYTSGTTGRPKGVRRQMPLSLEQSREIRARSLKSVQTCMGIQAGSRCLLSAPLYHSAPSSYLMTALQAPAWLRLEERFDALRTLEIIERDRITHAYLVPTMYVRLLRLPQEVRQRFDLSSLQFVASTGSPCAFHVKRAMIDWLGPVIHETYASSETSYITHVDSHEALRKPGSAGRPIAGAMVRILDPNGREQPVGQAGRIFARNLNAPDFTYIGNEHARRDMEEGGLVSVGDVGYLDEDGYLFICDRAVDMVISGGVNIYPAEVESVLLGVPGVADCAVIGVPDAEFGESLVAFVQPLEDFPLTSDAVRQQLLHRMAGFKVPRTILFRPVLPREESGKIFKRKLKQEWALENPAMSASSEGTGQLS